jgi:predicted Zn-dependent protease
MRLTPRLFSISVILAYTLYCPTGWAQDKRDDISKIGQRDVAHKTDISQKKEIEIGRKAAAEYEAKFKLIMDSWVISYIDRVTQNVALNSDLKIPLLVKIVASSDPSADVLPGGFTYISSGLIQIMDDEGQLAGVIAYGAADVATRHWAAEQTKAAMLQYAMLPLIFTPISSGKYNDIMQKCENGMPLAMHKFRRGDVVESDYLALQYLYKAGYDPESYITLLGKFEKIEGTRSDRTPETFRDRPPAQVRIANCQKEISRILPPRKPSLPANAEFDKVKALLPNAPSPKAMP